MRKHFRSISQQVRILQDRGVETDERTPGILQREGYYAVVNGYGKAFLDDLASTRARDDRFVAGTTFESIYQLFLFDRELRALVFRAVMCVECTLRSILSYTFCEHHPKTEAYLRRGCYAVPTEYLRGRDAHYGDLTWLINTLEHHARGHVSDEHDDEPRDGIRVAWYREHYEAVPLWVLFSDLTFGNLRYFFALMKRDEQRAVCARMRESCGTTCDGGTLSPQEMLADLEALSDLRNDCAHEARIYDAHFGPDERDFHAILDTLVAYLAEEDERHLLVGIRDLVTRYAQVDAGVARVLRDAGLTTLA